MKKILFTLALVGVCAITAYTQNYKSAIGLRLGIPNSISFKTFISEPGAIEIFAGFRNYRNLDYSWFNVGGLYQHHFPITGAPGLKWYVGGGVSAFFWNYEYDLPGTDDTNLSVGILGNLGLDYKIATAPINLSVDWVPSIFVNGFDSGFGAGYGAFSIRYTLK